MMDGAVGALAPFDVGLVKLVGKLTSRVRLPHGISGDAREPDAALRGVAAPRARPRRELRDRRAIEERAVATRAAH